MILVGKTENAKIPNNFFLRYHFILTHKNLKKKKNPLPQITRLTFEAMFTCLTD